MLDALKSITGGRNRLAQKQTAELESLIATAREERATISLMLTALTTRSMNLMPIGRSLEQVTEKATSLTGKIDEIAKRLGAVEDRTKELDQVDKRIQALQEAARQAEQTTQKALGPDGELQKHREAVDHLSSQALQTRASLEALKKEGAILGELRDQLRSAKGEVEQSVGHTTTLKTELDQVRATATALSKDYTKIRESSREAREDSDAAMATVKEVESKLGHLARLHELSQTTEDRLASLNALAEHVSHKAKALESQQHAVEHAVVQANRVNEMVWAMDEQMTKINDGMKQTAKAEEMINRIEKIADDASRRMDEAAKLNQEVQRETTRLEKDGRVLLESVRTEVSALSGHKKEFETFNARQRALEASVGEAESRMEALAVKDKNLAALTQKADGLAKQFETLFAQSDELMKRQLTLDSLRDRLSEVDNLATKTSWQMDSLKQSRQELEVLRKEIQEFHESHADLAKLRDALGADRRALEAFGGRITAMTTRAPELEAKMDAILSKMAVVEDATREAAHLTESVANLEAQIARVTARAPFVEQLGARLDGLNSLSGDVDKRLVEQLTHRAELDTLKTACQGLTAQMDDARHKLDGVRALENTLVPLVAQVDTLKTEIALAKERIAGVKYDHAVVIEQEKRLAELVAASRTIATEVTERSVQMQALSEDLARSANIKDELFAEIDRIQSRQRDVVGQIHASEDQLARTEQKFKQLEQRRTEIAFGEKKLAAVETRLVEVKHLATELDKSIASINSRDQLVSAVKAEVDHVHEISARSKADLIHVIEHRDDVAALKTRVDELLGRLAETDERITAVDAQRKVVDEVQQKANAMAHLLDDVRINLETLGEQKAVVDHVAEKVAQLEFTLQEARNTLRALQQERELAERIESGIKQLRSKTGASDAGKRGPYRVLSGTKAGDAGVQAR